MKDRARALLIRHLNEQQRADYEAAGGFWVTAPSGHFYWICGTEQNQPTRRYEGSKVVDRFCYHTYDRKGKFLPAGDHLLAQKLLIEANEALFLKTANPLPIREPSAPRLSDFAQAFLIIWTWGVVLTATGAIVDWSVPPLGSLGGRIIGTSLGDWLLICLGFGALFAAVSLMLWIGMCGAAAIWRRRRQAA